MARSHEYEPFAARGADAASQPGAKFSEPELAAETLATRMHLLINSLVTMLRLEEDEPGRETSEALAAAYEPFVGFAPVDPDA